MGRGRRHLLRRRGQREAPSGSDPTTTQRATPCRPQHPAMTPRAACALLLLLLGAGATLGSLPPEGEVKPTPEVDHKELADVIHKLNSKDVTIDEPGFLRQIRKYSRRLWLINCSARRRRLCHCYSRQLRQYFCCDCDAGPCFPGAARASTPRGTVPMSNLTVGQVVLAGDGLGHVVESRVLGFLDKRPDEEAVYTTLRTASGAAVTLSGNHLIFAAAPNESAPAPRAASLVRPGHRLLTLEEASGWTRHNASTLTLEEVAEVSHAILKGAFVPLTEHGTLVVGGALASCYASFPHALAHWALAPARLAPALLLDSEESQHEAGVRFFPRLLKAVGRALLPALEPASTSQVLRFDLRPYD